MAIGIKALIDAITSHASSSGLFDIVQAHEPKSPPGNGLSYAVYLSALAPIQSSGTAVTSARVELTGRIYKPFLSDPEDLIDPNIADAADKLFEAYSGDFTLGGLAREVDLLGAHGNPLNAEAGYQNISGTVFRVLDIIIPIIVNDAWNQEA
jgi:hypothetical protein